MNIKTMGLVALLGAAALVAGCDDDDDDGLPALSGPQTGSINVNLGTSAVTFPTQPQGVKMSGSAVYDDPTDTVTLSLTLTNKTKTLVPNPKLVPTNLSEGTITGDGTIADGGGDPYIYYGPEAMISNAQVTREITINGVTGAGTDVTMDIEVLLHPYFALTTGFDGIAVVDSSGSGQSAEIDVEPLGFLGVPPLDGGPADTMLSAYTSSADGRYVHFSCRNQPAVGKLDLSDLSVTLGNSLSALPVEFDGTGAVGTVDSLTSSPDGNFIYAVLNDGCHTFRGSSELYPAPSVKVVKLNKTLGVVDSVEVFPATVIPPVADGGATFVQYRGTRLSISADGARGVLAVHGLGEVFALNLSNMTVFDTDDVAPDTQGFDVSATSFNCRFAALSPDGSTIYVAYNTGSDGTLDVIDVATGDITTEAPLTLAAGDTKVGFLEFGPDGRLYYGRNNYSVPGEVPGVSIFNPGTDAWVELADIANANSISFGATSYCVADEEDSTIQCFAYADDTTVVAPGSLTDSIDAPVGFGHGLVLTD